jgi:hypothetical protein
MTAAYVDSVEVLIQEPARRRKALPTRSDPRLNEVGPKTFDYPAGIPQAWVPPPPGDHCEVTV